MLLKTSFEEIRAKFKRMNAWGLLSSIDLHNCNPEKIRDGNIIREFVDKLCELIEMRKFGDCIIVNFGEDERVSGFSMCQLIETSLISGHFADQTNTAYIDIFSCKLYDPYKAAEFTRDFFEGTDFRVHLIYRK